MSKWFKPLGALVIIILAASVLSRLLTGGETLEQYAKSNPDLAYATPKASIKPTDWTDAPSPAGQTVSPDAFSASGSVTFPTASPSDGPTSFSGDTPSQAQDASFFMPVDTEAEDSTHYADGFFYQPLSDAVIAKITGISYPVSEALAPALSNPAVNLMAEDEIPVITYDELRYMNVLYYDFNGEVQTGELICNQRIAEDLIEIFYELYKSEYRIEKIRLIEEYGGDDTASMLDNNTSCFNYRTVDNTSSLSKHAIGCAIDINPFYNPYVVFNKNGSGEPYISPEGSEIYADRSQSFPYKIDENDLCYKLFKEHGFVWGGDWNSCKDYQHFQKVVE